MNVLTKNRAVLEFDSPQLACPKTPFTAMSIDQLEALVKMRNTRELVAIPYAILERLVIHESSLVPDHDETVVRHRPIPRRWKVASGVLAVLVTLVLVLSAVEARHTLLRGVQHVAFFVRR